MYVATLFNSWSWYDILKFSPYRADAASSKSYWTRLWARHSAGGSGVYNSSDSGSIKLMIMALMQGSIYIYDSI